VLRRIDLRELARLARRELPAPVDVLNLIRADETRFERYRWYGLLVTPALLLAGGSVRWMGRHERALDGERQADRLLVVRYPSHRRFLAMTLNPYYLAVNRLRESGVRGFEASFTHATVCDPGLDRREVLLAVHFKSAPGEEALPRVREALGGRAGPLVYASREIATFSFLDPLLATDPNPLNLPEVAFFAPSRGELDGVVTPAFLRRLRTATTGLSLQVYQRDRPTEYRPRVLRRRPTARGVAPKRRPAE
jgi:uncharacterized protein (DUF1330 family)